jgi:hypothetical protein
MDKVPWTGKCRVGGKMVHLLKWHCLLLNAVAPCESEEMILKEEPECEENNYEGTNGAKQHPRKQNNVFLLK